VDPITPNTTSVVATASTSSSSSSVIQDQNEQNQFILSMANAFSGGVFLSLAFGHLIPECVHGFLDVISNSDTTTSSSHHHHNMETVPYLCVLCGYLIIFFVEKVAFSNTHDLLLHPEHHYHPPPPPPAALPNEENHHHSHPYMNGSSHTTSVSSPTTEAATTTSGLATGRSALILLGALAVHSILEMMALGLADTFRDCALLTISISLHQPAESIALLVAFIKSGLSESQIILFLSIFSCMGMIGVLTGTIVNEYAAPIVDSIMLAIVAGTFVYVGATEIIPEEFESSQYKWKKFMALFSGIATILCITQYTATLGGGH
jgi:zinc transporter 1/2/3